MTIDAASQRSPVAPHIYDGYQVHRAALAYGLTVLALPRQVLLAGRKSAVPAAISFTHGVPEASTMSAVTYAQDRRLRRALLERVGLPVPRGATFTWRSIDRAAQWVAREPGYPVVVKETVGENPAKTILDVSSDDELMAAFQVLRRRRPEDRSPGRNRDLAGYAANRLGFQIDDDGNEVAPPRTRFLIERQLRGVYVRIFACGDETPVSVVMDPRTGEPVRDVSAQLDASFSTVALRAVRGVPGLAAATVDIILEDPTSPADTQEHHIVELAERPRAASYATADESLGDRIGDTLVRFQAGQANLVLPPQRKAITTDIRVEGLRDAAAVAAGFTTAASGYDVDGAVAVTDDLEGIVAGTCHGTPAAIAALNESLMNGDLLGDRSSCIESRVEA
ncbi:hypothetical protein [Phytoactinopolyspora mesophila]|uniref:ATP-grasp domain-containing protein n=1 Tax=Phytoactinopolyspora mesophila TaxID=2650750 RepID=A0A7K3M2C7_9ACTN|nr:hypothetical protein [Phytoactinopolyspora mesophila]NDL57419.1 hypothetical protein [Phytoactinopolyspora mesophila]